MHGLHYLALGIAFGLLAGALFTFALGFEYLRRFTVSKNARIAALQIGYEQRIQEIQRRGGALIVKMIHQERGPQWLYFHSLPREKALHTLRRAQYRSFSEREMNHLSRSEFRAFRQELIQRGLLRWIDEAHHRLGVEWTGPGEAALRAVEAEQFEALEQQEHVAATA